MPDGITLGDRRPSWQRRISTMDALKAREGCISDRTSGASKGV